MAQTVSFTANVTAAAPEQGRRRERLQFSIDGKRVRFAGDVGFRFGHF